LSCGPGSYERQELYASYVLDAISYAESKGVQVDLFGTTFQCFNNETFHKNLTTMYRDRFKSLRILGAEAFKTSTQMTSVRDVYDQALQHMKQEGKFYDQVYLLRWDALYYCKHFRFEDMHQFPQDQGPQSPAMLNVAGGAADLFYLVPGRYLLCFHEWVFNSSAWAQRSWSSERGGCCWWPKGPGGKPCEGGGDCNECIPKFWKSCCSDLEQSRAVSSWKSSCEGLRPDSWKSSTDGREIDPPSWLPLADTACDSE